MFTSKDLKKLIIPLIFEQLLAVSVGFVDTFMVSIAGEAAVSGVALVDNISNLLIQILSALATGGAVVCSQYLGSRNINMSKKSAGQLIFIMSALSSLLMVISLIGNHGIINFIFGKIEKDVFVSASIYFYITAISYPFLGVYNAGAALFRSIGNSKISMNTSLIMNIINICGNALFIFVFDMGVAGAAIATVIAQILSCLFALFFLFGKRPPVKISFGGYSAGIMLRIVAIGLSPFLILATDSVIMIVMNTVLQKTGGTSADMLIAAATIVQSYMMLITGPLGGISGGTQAIISFNYGAGKTDRVRAAEKKILLMCVVFTGVMFIASRFLAEAFAGIFITGAEEIALAGWGIRTFTLAIIPLAFQYALVDGLTAMGRTKTALFLSMFRKGSYALLIVIFAFVLGARNTFYAEPVVDLVGAIMSTTIFLLVFEKHMKNRMEAEII